MLLTVAMGERVLRLVGVHRDHRPGGDEPVRLGRAPGGVPPLPGRLPEHREGDHEAELPGASRRGSRQVPAEGVQARARRGAPARCTSTCRTTSGSRTADVEVPEPEERSLQLNWRTPGSPEAVAKALEMLLEGEAAADPRRRRRRSAPRRARELAAFAEHVNVPVYSTLHGQGRALGPAPAPPRDRRLLGRVPGARRRRGTPT